MDLGVIGAHCHSCGVLDLLPIKCPYCSNTFCKLHSSIISHPCHITNSSSAFNAAAGPSTTTTRSERCELTGCDLKRMRTYHLQPGLNRTADTQETPLGEDVKCAACSKAFCLSHRTPQSHSCDAPPPTLSAQQVFTKSLISSHFPQSTPSTTSHPDAGPSQPRPPPPSVPPPKKKKKISPVIELMRIQQGALPGRGEISERKDRFHLRVGVDLKGEIIAAAGVDGADVETGKEGEKGVYFKRDLTVAVILQSIINAKKIPYDPIAGDPSSSIHLVAFLPVDRPSTTPRPTPPSPSTATPQILDRLKRIDACGLADGARVWVVKGEGSWSASQ